MSDLYRASGVDIKKGDELVDWLQSSSQQTSPFGEVVSGIGGFAGLFRPNFSTFQDPVLVAGTDGVGTKVLLGSESGQIEGLGIDLVAMCVNDLYTVGGIPLFFLDYYATGVLDDTQFKQVLSGIRTGLKQSDALLLGGETAELPGLYAKGHFDLAGFVVGVVDGTKKLRPENVTDGDIVIAFQSSGLHSNGYSLVRKWLSTTPESRMFMDQIMTPTKIYSEIPKLIGAFGPETIHAMANITGGGISGNLPRVMPANFEAQIQLDALPTPAWMKEFIAQNKATIAEVEPVFNLGAGMVCCVDKTKAKQVMTMAEQCGLEPSQIGKIAACEGKARVSYT